MIENANLRDALANNADFSVVCEIYPSDAVPSSDGFDPADALACYAAADEISVKGVPYDRQVKSFGSINRTITKEINSASVTFSNVDRTISSFEFSNGFEGLILAIRLVSRSLTDLADTQILFTGRCDKPDSGDKESLTVKAKFILGGLAPVIPRRKFGPEDHEGRVPGNPEFEGFIDMPQSGDTSYSVREKRRTPWGLLAGIVGFLFIKRTVNVTKTLHWSSFSDLDANKCVPEVFGRAQMLGVHIGYRDTGLYVQVRTAFCEGPIDSFQNVRSLDSRLPLSPTSYDEALGDVGTANGPDDPAWVSPGLFSRTAHIRAQGDNSLIEDVDPAPDIAAVIFGRTMPIPDGLGGWTSNGWSNNAAAITRFLLTDQYYYNLDAAWVDDAKAIEAFDYNAELIVNKDLSDYLFVEAG